ncbi:DEAD/DEAH box helicase family protein [Nonlabens ponticola]|uniref:Restriction endonuclease subunit R n=1 Tax=Nonlabens ponticola TaxID=2496866 RepID=A0A3S9MYK9_9FLAO|nr:DEAD/DEAH box helicase family protein [Nonlabens ponticola]AZQ44204.1 restriction endonuclease subunit R [Nonlabens ponticola]
MTEYPKDIQFKYPWRKYQEKVLRELNHHLRDKHLHIIAPPGSGKTVLGIEVAIRLNKPTLILGPTLAIRNQWIQRFCELFLQTNVTPDWISRDIRNPDFLTVVTYQGLHAACNNWNLIEEEFEEEEDADVEETPSRSSRSELSKIVGLLQSKNIGTIVVDEAHHLKKEWWHTLIQIKSELDPVIVGLTATPPYDVNYTQWHRYISLNGPIDTEISVPELVIEEDLCPHQDYVHFTMPTKDERRKIINFRTNVGKLYREVKADDTLAIAVEQHPIWQNPLDHLDWIYDNLQYYSAILIFLKSFGKEIPESHQEVINDKNAEIPAFDYRWAEELLEFYLFREEEAFPDFIEHQKRLLSRLKRYGAVERNKVNFLYNRNLAGLLTSSISKINSIQEIVDFERSHLGCDLRLVILSDYIRKEYLINENENSLDLNKMGVIPIFEKLRRSNRGKSKIGVLTGSIIIIPDNAYGALQAKAFKNGLDEINTVTLTYDNEYLIINRTEQNKNQIVHLITELFEDGEIEILVGTKSLLGEGWDAPCINTLILATFVGSFVLSNQMRGRAIRTQNLNLDKTANIWHLACIDSSSPNGGTDFDLLKRRFRGFVGVSNKEKGGIENGMDRLNLPELVHLEKQAIQANLEMFKQAGNRKNLKQRWDDALKTGVTLVEELKLPFPNKTNYQAVKTIHLNDTITNFIYTLIAAIVTFFFENFLGAFKDLFFVKTTWQFYTILLVPLMILIVTFGGKTLKAFRLYFKYRDISKDLHKIGDVLLRSLIHANVIKSSYSSYKVITSVNEYGTVYCHLEGGTTYDKSTFINALQEIVSVVDNPRCILIRKNKLMGYLSQKDYHAIPEVLGRNKKTALFFKDTWEQYVGDCELIFTRTVEGRKFVLTSRMKSLASQFDEEAEHVNIWR